MNRLGVFLGLIGLLLVLHDAGGAGGAGPSLAVSPDSGPEGKIFVVTGDGLAPSQRYAVTNTGTNGIQVGSGQVETDPNGHFSEIYNSVGDPPDTYTVAILPLGGGPALATAAYTIVAAGGAAPVAPPTPAPSAATPGSLPATGGGGMAGPSGRTGGAAWVVALVIALPLLHTACNHRRRAR